MFYKFITSGYTDTLAYSSALLAALWIFVARQYASDMPKYLASVPTEYGLVVAAFSGALFICKYICLDGAKQTISLLNTEKNRLEGVVRNRDLAASELNKKIIELETETGVLRNRIAMMEENSPATQLSDMRKKLRAAEDDKIAALTVMIKNLQARLDILADVHDSQMLYAVDVLRQEVELVVNEIKRGELSYYELCLKVVDISDNLSDLREIELAASIDQTVKKGSVADIWLNFIRANDNADHASVERSFKFFKVAFHPDRFDSESLKVEATRYFQHSINAHNSVKRMDKEAK
jgi:hypothetical protein